MVPSGIKRIRQPHLWRRLCPNSARASAWGNRPLGVRPQNLRAGSAAPAVPARERRLQHEHAQPEHDPEGVAAMPARMRISHSRLIARVHPCHRWRRRDDEHGDPRRKRHHDLTRPRHRGQRRALRQSDRNRRSRNRTSGLRKLARDDARIRRRRVVGARIRWRGDDGQSSTQAAERHCSMHVSRRFALGFFIHDAKLFAPCPPWPHASILLHEVNRAPVEFRIA